MREEHQKYASWIFLDVIFLGDEKETRVRSAGCYIPSQNDTLTPTRMVPGPLVTLKKKGASNLFQSLQEFIQESWFARRLPASLLGARTLLGRSWPYY